MVKIVEITPGKSRRRSRGKKIVVQENLQIARPIRKKKRQSKRQGPRRLNALLRGGQTMALRELCDSVLNPFDVSGCIPDGAIGRGCFSIKQQYVIGTGTGTSCAFLASPDPDSCFYQDTGSANATPTFSGNIAACNAVTTADGMFGSFRTISGAIRASYVGNTNTDQGLIVLGQVDRRQVSASAFNGASLQSACQYLMWYRSYPLRLGGQICWRPDDKEAMDSWTTLGNGVGTVAQLCRNSYLVLFVYGANANTASLLNIEVIWNFEGTFRQQTLISGGTSEAKTPPAVPGWYETMRNVVDKVEPIAPAVGSGGTGGVLASLGSMANGIMSEGLVGYGLRRGWIGPPKLSIMDRLDNMD